MCDQQRLRPACAFAQSDQSFCKSLDYSMNIKLLTEQHLEFLSLKGGYTGSSESSLFKMPHSWKPHVTAQIYSLVCLPQMIKMTFNAFYLSNIIMLCSSVHAYITDSFINVTAVFVFLPEGLHYRSLSGSS